MVLSPSRSPIGHSGIGSGRPKYSHSPRSAATGSSGSTRLERVGLERVGDRQAVLRRQHGGLHDRDRRVVGEVGLLAVLLAVRRRRDGRLRLAGLPDQHGVRAPHHQAHDRDRGRVERDPPPPRPEERQGAERVLDEPVGQVGDDQCGGRDQQARPARRRPPDRGHDDQRRPVPQVVGVRPVADPAHRRGAEQPLRPPRRCGDAATEEQRGAHDRQQRGVPRDPRALGRRGARPRRPWPGPARRHRPGARPGAGRCAGARRRRRLPVRAPRPGRGSRSTPPAGPSRPAGRRSRTRRR